MSNEPSKSPTADKQLTRIPVRQIFWKGNSKDHAGASQISNTKCFAEPIGVPSKWSAVYIPAWQHIELTFVAGQGATAVVEMIPIADVGRWTMLV